MKAAIAPSLQLFWQQVSNTPHAFDLYVLLRWLDARAGMPVRLGRATHPGDEPLRIGQQASLAFAPATLASAAPGQDGAPARVSIYSFGLFGPNGPLPLHLTEYAYDRLHHHGDSTLSAFADLFHHRLILLFYRAWADAQPTVSLDGGPGARFDAYIASLIHAGLPSQLKSNGIAAHASYYMAGHLVRQTRNPVGLQHILCAFLGVPVEIVEFVPHWIPVGPRQRTRLRTSSNGTGLGCGAMLGKAVRDVQSKFELRVGPLSREQYRDLLPDTRRSRQVVEWVRHYAGIEWAWDMRLVMSASQVHGNSLGPGQPLGWGSWLGTRHGTGGDADEFVYQPEAYSSQTCSA
ncbi:type VI secretion system baseplate subunit TssG [Paraburkholderia sp. BCC1884]|uniref:type VI secretion system baseplate subunit TssG n=1 Tax=Paraburkholderia sp. BCC1884 TaxID=2562668 RepID=UPI0011837BD0|nr:type VI secretion system baseplate subunit TssG [Paraburkholderia sp. BCC1884]